MKFYIVTPSLNQLDYLKRCVASVADQVGPGIQVHHHVQDACSTDGTVAWLTQYAAQQPEPGNYQITFTSEADEGMYDAINKGIAFATTPADNCQDEIFAWLNCDEQYLPGALRKAASFFEAHAETDILFGGMIIVDPQGQFLSCRKAMPMRRLFLEASYLYNFSCAMFVRAPFWTRLGGLDVRYKNAGDEDLVRRAIRRGANSAVLNEYLSAFMYAEGNLSSSSGALAEHEALKRTGSFTGRFLRLPVNLMRLTEKWLRGGCHQKGPLEYALRTDSPHAGEKFEVARPTCRWPDESRPYLNSHRLK